MAKRANRPSTRKKKAPSRKRSTADSKRVSDQKSILPSLEAASPVLEIHGTRIIPDASWPIEIAKAYATALQHDNLALASFIFEASAGEPLSVFDSTWTALAKGAEPERTWDIFELTWGLGALKILPALLRKGLAEKVQKAEKFVSVVIMRIDDNDLKSDELEIATAIFKGVSAPQTKEEARQACQKISKATARLGIHSGKIYRQLVEETFADFEREELAQGLSKPGSHADASSSKSLRI